LTKLAQLIIKKFKNSIVVSENVRDFLCSANKQRNDSGGIAYNITDLVIL